MEYDPSAPALYIRLRDGRVAGSEPLSDALILDLDEHGEIIGLEVLLPPDTPKEVVAKLEKIASKLSLGSGGA